MADTSAHIGDLDATYPPGSESRKMADNIFRHLKTVLKTDFAEVKGPVTASHTELNYTDGVTAPIQTQLDAKAPIASPTFTGTPAAPTPTSGDNSTALSTTAFVQTEIARVNALTGLTYLNSDATSVSISVGQHVQCRAGTAVAVTWPTGTVVGQIASVAFENGLYTNSINFGAQSIKGPNGVIRSGVVTWDLLAGLRAVWGGDYWRAMP